MKLQRALFSLCLASGWILMTGCAEDTQNVPAPSSYKLSVYQLNDQHSHWLGLPNGSYTPERIGDGTKGGAARWVPLVESGQAANPDTLLVSAGDFTMGTLLVAAQNSAGDLNTMKAVGFDVAGLGNHEFDWGPGLLAKMIKAAKTPRIPLVVANIKFSSSDPADDELEALYGKQGQSGKSVHPYVVIDTKSHVKVGVFGLVGLRAAGVSNAAPVTFSKDMAEMIQTAQDVVTTLREQEKVDVVLCLAHLGITAFGDAPAGESVELLQKVRGIDILMSGHEHTEMQKPLQINYEGAESWTTVAMEAGSYGRMLGHYELIQDNETRTITGETIPVVDSLPGSAKVSQIISALVADVEKKVLSKFDRIPTPGAVLDGKFLQDLTPSSFDLRYHSLESSGLSYLVADAMREVTGADFAAISNAADVREGLPRSSKGTFDLADVFMVSPLGLGPDGLPGYPLIKAYLTLFELYMILEGSTCDIGLTSDEYFVTTSGMRIVFDPKRPKLGRIIKMIQYKSLDESDPGVVIFENGFKVPSSTLYSIALASYTAQFVSSLGLKLKNEKGKPVEDLLSLMVIDDQGREIKQWYAVAKKLSTLGEKGISQYNDDPAQNPIGPNYRRIWNIANHPLP